MEMYQTICRVCLLQFEDITNMMSLVEDTKQKRYTPYGIAVLKFSNNSVLKDNFPDMICEKCLVLLKQAIRFKNICQSSYYQLKKIADFIKGSTEDLKQSIIEYSLYKTYILTSNSEAVDAVSLDSQINLCQDLSSEINCDLHNYDSYEITPAKVICNLKHITNEANEKQLKKDQDLFLYPTKFKSNYWSNEDYELDRLENLIDSGEFGVLNSQLHFNQTKNKLLRLNNRVKYSKSKKKNVLKNKDLKQNITCKICNKILANENTYKNHLQRHKGCRYICEICSKGFPTASELNHHQVAVHNVGIYKKCPYCDYKSSRTFHFNEHLRIHTGERPFVCEKCPQTFRTKYTFHLHKAIHGEKKVKCLRCSHLFFTRNRMLEHFNSRHERLYMFSCHLCGVQYAKNKTMRWHLTEKHNIPREKQGKIVRIKIRNINCTNGETIHV